MDLKVGDIIRYGTYESDNFIDEICCEKTKKNKIVYFGQYEVNHATSEKKGSLKELLQTYTENWENVTIIRGEEEYPIKKIEDVLKYAYVLLERKVDSKIIKIIKTNKKMFYTEYEKETLVYYEKI